jgi:succinylglutamate desuccinylase
VALDFLAHFGLIERAMPATHRQPAQRFELLQTCMVTDADFRFSRPLIGFEAFAKGELIATQGADEIRSPCDGCTVLMPTREPIVGREAVYLSRRMT